MMGMSAFDTRLSSLSKSSMAMVLESVSRCHANEALLPNESPRYVTCKVGKPGRGDDST